MAADEGSIILGSAVTLFASFSFCLNCTVLWTLWRHNFLSKQHDGIFILAFANMSGNVFALFIYGAYLGPAAITQTYLFSSLYPYPKFIGAAWHAQWYQDMLLMAFTAINRWIVIVKPPYLPVFTRTHTIIFIIFAYSAGIFITILATYVLPCCMLYFEYSTISFAYFVDGPNDIDHFLDYPVNVTCMTVAVLCYIRIYWFVRSSNTKIMSNLPKSAVESRKTKETKYAFQFAACTFCVIAIDIIFHTLPLILPPGHDRFFIIVSFLEMIHSSVNASIFIVFNPEIRKRLFLFGSQKGHNSLTPPAVGPQHIPII